MVEVTLQVTASGILRDGIEVGDVEVDDFGALRLHVGDRPFHVCGSDNGASGIGVVFAIGTSGADGQRRATRARASA
jgi:hypothetical protein